MFQPSEWRAVGNVAGNNVAGSVAGDCRFSRCIVGNEIHIEIEFFAGAVELAGARRWQSQVPAGSTIADVRGLLLANFEKLARLAPLSRWAIGTEFVADSFVLHGDTTVVMIPPVSGG